MNLGQVRAYVRSLLNEPTAAFWTDADLNIFINRSYVNLYANVAMQGRNFFVTTTNISYVASQELYTLPAYQKLMLVERVDSAPNNNLLPIDLVEKNDYQLQAAGFPSGQERYFLTAASIGIAPVPSGAIANVLKVWYVPTPTLLVADGDTFPTELLDIHHEAIAQGAFMRATQRDKEMLALTAPIYKDLMKTVLEDTTVRQQQQPRGIIDTDTVAY